MLYTLLIIVGAIAGSVLLFVLALLTEIAFGASPGQQYRRAQRMERDIEEAWRHER